MILYNIHPRDMNINISFEIINTNKYTAPSAYIRTTQRALPCFSYILNIPRHVHNYRCPAMPFFELSSFRTSYFRTKVAEPSGPRRELRTSLSLAPFWPGLAAGLVPPAERKAVFVSTSTSWTPFHSGCQVFPLGS